MKATEALKYADKNSSGEHLVIGCNYHTTWQSHNRMRFILIDIKGDKALLGTRTTKKRFWTKADNLIFIKTGYNFSKARDIIKKQL